MHTARAKRSNWSGNSRPVLPSSGHRTDSLTLIAGLVAAQRSGHLLPPAHVLRIASARRRLWLFLPCLITLSCLVHSCGISQLGREWPSQRVPVGAGPEDLVLDTLTSQPRLLVSCDARRASEPPAAGIWALDLTTRQSRELPRLGEPESLVFHPHGLDLAQQAFALSSFSRQSVVSGEGPLAPSQGQPVPILYVISHDDERDVHSVIAYQVFADHLQFVRSWTDPLLNSPNALTVLEDGTLLVTNDSGVRGSRTEALLKRRKSTVVAWNAARNAWWEAADNLAYANGIVCRGSEVFVASTRQSQVFGYRWDGEKLNNPVTLADVAGADNLRWDGQDLLVAGHPNILAFVRHAGSAARKSPVEVWRMTTPGQSDSSMVKRLYANDGSAISGAATALIWQGHLYLSQVFDPFVLVVELP